MGEAKREKREPAATTVSEGAKWCKPGNTMERGAKGQARAEREARGTENWRRQAKRERVERGETTGDERKDETPQEGEVLDQKLAVTARPMALLDTDDATTWADERMESGRGERTPDWREARE